MCLTETSEHLAAWGRLATQEFNADHVKRFNWVRHAADPLGPNFQVFPDTIARLDDRDVVHQLELSQGVRVRFLPPTTDGADYRIGYVADVGGWELKSHGAEMEMQDEHAVTYRAPLVAGWNVVEFRCGMANANTLERALVVTLNERQVGPRLGFNGHLVRLYVEPKRGAVVVANGGVEIGETRRSDPHRPRRDR